jgi:hypothetical protein
MRMFINQGDLMSTNDEAAPFSAWLGWPVLQPFKSSVQLAPSKSNTTLIDDPTPLSNWFKWPVLKPFESNVVLLDDPTPLSNKLGLSVLQDSTPFSTLSPDQNGKANLIDNATPFSEFFNLPVLWKDYVKRNDPNA